MFYSFIFAQILILIWFLKIFQRRKIGFYSLFFVIHWAFLAIPFFFIFMYVQDYFDLSFITGRSPDAKTDLDLGDGVTPLIVVLLFQFFYLLGGTIQASTERVEREQRVYYIDLRRYVLYACMAFFAAGFYIFVRYYFVGDFPLFLLLSGKISVDSVIRDISFDYVTNPDVPYYFLPSINQQFYRVLLPLSAFVLAVATHYSDNRKLKYLMYLTVLSALMMNIGSLKRMPLLQLMVWFFAFHYMYANWRAVFPFVRLCLFIFVFGVLMTAFYKGYDEGLAFVLVESLPNLLWRLLVGEAVGEFLAVEYFGKSIEHLNFGLFTTYWQKVLGQDVMTFSEFWKIESGGKRGFTSIGFMGEMYVCFGFLAVFPYLFLGYLLSFFDYKASIAHASSKPFLAALMMMIGFASIKGILSQLFTGGVLVVSLAWAAMLLFGCVLSQKSTGQINESPVYSY